MTTDTARLQAFVGLMNSGRYDEARSLVSSEIVISEPASIPYGGEFRGLEGFDQFRRAFAATRMVKLPWIPGDAEWLGYLRSSGRAGPQPGDARAGL